MVRHYIPRNWLHIIQRPSLPKLCLEFKYCQNTTKNTQINQLKKNKHIQKNRHNSFKIRYKTNLQPSTARYRDGTCHIKLQVLTALRLQGLGVRSILVHTQYQDYRVLACSRLEHRAASCHTQLLKNIGHKTGAH